LARFEDKVTRLEHAFADENSDKFGRQTMPDPSRPVNMQPLRLPIMPILEEPMVL
jgi:hypothetical protein